MKKSLVIVFLSVFIWSCGGSDTSTTSSEAPKSMVKEEPADDGKGIGETKEVKLNDPLNQDMVKRGEAIYDMKCAACHKLSATRVVGPGWAGLTDKRKPEWIMNMITNVAVMLDEDPVARKLFEECLTRMPNQNVSLEDARDILEFIYQNDINQASK